MGGGPGTWLNDVKLAGGRELGRRGGALAQTMDDEGIEGRITAARELVWAMAQKVKG